MSTMTTARTTQGAAVRHILTAPAIAARTAPHLDGPEGPDWPALLGEAADMSYGQGLLIRVAHDLGEGTALTPVWELPVRLGPAAFARVVEALAMYRGEGAWVASDVPPLAAAA
ncbi:MAG: hypothetical protein AB7O78_18020 [Thermoleophilia bacterium]